MKELAGVWRTEAELDDGCAIMRLVKEAFERLVGWVAVVMAWSFWSSGYWFRSRKNCNALAVPKPAHTRRQSMSKAQLI
jgi:hypothetical protein